MPRIVHTVRACECGTTHSIFGRGVFIQEFHPLLPGEQLALWAKLNLAKFCANTKHEH